MRIPAAGRSAVVVVAFLLAISAPTPTRASFHPNVGDLFYNGALYADAYLWWLAPGPWSVEEPGYEHDLAIFSRDFFGRSCVTWTSLPDAYDDCPTAGVLEDNPSLYVFSFGTFSARSIRPNVTYMGSWRWSARSGSATTVRVELAGQEVRKRFCPFNNIWCMGGTGRPTKTLLPTPLQPFGISFNWQGHPSFLTYEYPAEYGGGPPPPPSPPAPPPPPPQDPPPPPDCPPPQQCNIP